MRFMTAGDEVLLASAFSTSCLIKQNHFKVDLVYTYVHPQREFSQTSL